MKILARKTTAIRSRFRRFMITLVLLSSGWVVLGQTATPTQKPDSQPQPSLRLNGFVDRNSLKAGEQFNINAWVESELTDSVAVKISYPQPLLVLSGKREETISLPQSQPLVFTFTGTEVGKANILIRVTGVNKKTGLLLAESQQINAIEIQSRNSYESLVTSSLLGTLLGALLTLVTTYIAELRQKRNETSKRRLWLTASLPAELERDRLAIGQKQKADGELWTSKLVADGYYKDLQDLTTKTANPGGLVDGLIAISSDLREYEQQRTHDRLVDTFRTELSGKLENVVRQLRQL
jgi:hypothetical protein